MQAKALAFAMGADYLEQDIVATRDDLVAAWLDAPVELPDEREAWLQPPSALFVAASRICTTSSSSFYWI